MISLFGKSLSVEFLKKKCKKIFKHHFATIPYFPGYENFHWPHELLNDSVVDVVLFGNALHLLTHPYLWPKFKSYRFWVVSKKHRELVIKIFELSESQVGYLPRYLFQKLPKKPRLMDLSKPLDFVISSRLSEDKNIEFSLHLVNYIQHIHNNKIRLTIFFPHGEINLLKEMIRKFSWKVEPVIKGDKGFNWQKEVAGQFPILLNASTSYFEDFSVSTMQAQMKGWPVILSDWGVFKEIETSNSYKIRYDFIKNYYDTKSFIKREQIIKSVVQELISEPHHKVDIKIIIKDEIIVPRPVPFREFKQKQAKWSKKITADLINIFSAKRDENHQSPLGRKIEKILSRV